MGLDGDPHSRLIADPGQLTRTDWWLTGRASVVQGCMVGRARPWSTRVHACVCVSCCIYIHNGYKEYMGLTVTRTVTIINGMENGSFVLVKGIDETDLGLSDKTIHILLAYGYTIRMSY